MTKKKRVIIKWQKTDDRDSLTDTPAKMPPEKMKKRRVESREKKPAFGYGAFAAGGMEASLGNYKTSHREEPVNKGSSKRGNVRPTVQKSRLLPGGRNCATALHWRRPMISRCEK